MRKTGGKRRAIGVPFVKGLALTVGVMIAASCIPISGDGDPGVGPSASLPGPATITSVSPPTTPPMAVTPVPEAAENSSLRLSIHLVRADSCEFISPETVAAPPIVAATKAEFYVSEYVTPTPVWPQIAVVDDPGLLALLDAFEQSLEGAPVRLSEPSQVVGGWSVIIRTPGSEHCAFMPARPERYSIVPGAEEPVALLETLLEKVGFDGGTRIALTLGRPYQATRGAIIWTSSGSADGRLGSIDVPEELDFDLPCNELEGETLLDVQQLAQPDQPWSDGTRLAFVSLRPLFGYESCEDLLGWQRLP